MNQEARITQSPPTPFGMAWSLSKVSRPIFTGIAESENSELKSTSIGFCSKGSTCVALTSDYKDFCVGKTNDYKVIAQIVVKWMQIPEPWVLSVDRTTWELGKHCYNILTLGIVHQGVAFPVLWWILEQDWQ